MSDETKRFNGIFGSLSDLTLLYAHEEMHKQTATFVEQAKTEADAMLMARLKKFVEEDIQKCMDQVIVVALEKAIAELLKSRGHSIAHASV
jgi:hypothetical protein